MDESPQSYENHTRWHAPFHYFVAPVLLTNVVVAVVQLIRDPGLDRGWWLVVSAALVVLAGLPKDPRVLRTIVKEAGQNLGLYAGVESGGRVRVGDEVELG